VCEGYWYISGAVHGLASEFGVSEEAAIAIGYSPPAILVVFIVAVVVSVIPVAWSLRKVKGDMVNGGTNSLVISAACHALVPNGDLRRGVSPESRNRESCYFSQPDPPRDLQTERTSLGLTSHQKEKEAAAATAAAAKQPPSEELEDPLITEENEDRETAALRELSRRKLRWGVVSLPPELADQLMTESGQVVKHLTFGGMEDEVQKPEDAQLYA
jgi:hypothetical protein